MNIGVMLESSLQTITVCPPSLTHTYLNWKLQNIIREKVGLAAKRFLSADTVKPSLASSGVQLRCNEGDKLN